MYELEGVILFWGWRVLRGIFDNVNWSGHIGMPTHSPFCPLLNRVGGCRSVPQVEFVFAPPIAVFGVKSTSFHSIFIAQ